MPLDCSWLDCRRGGGKMGSGNIETSPLHWSLIHEVLVIIQRALVIHGVLVIHVVLVIYGVLVIRGVLVIHGVLVQWQGVEGRMGVRQNWNKYKSIEVLKQVWEQCQGCSGAGQGGVRQCVTPIFRTPTKEAEARLPHRTFLQKNCLVLKRRGDNMAVLAGERDFQPSVAVVVL